MSKIFLFFFWPPRYLFRIRERISTPARALLGIAFVACVGWLWYELTRSESYIVALETSPQKPLQSIVDEKKDLFKEKFGARFIEAPDAPEKERDVKLVDGKLWLVGVRLKREKFDKFLPDLRKELPGVSNSKCATCGADIWEYPWTIEEDSTDPSGIRLRSKKRYFVAGPPSKKDAPPEPSKWDAYVASLTKELPFIKEADLESEAVTGGARPERRLVALSVAKKDFEANRAKIEARLGKTSFTVDDKGDLVVLRGVPRVEGRKINATQLPSPKEMWELVPQFVNTTWKSWKDGHRWARGVRFPAVTGTVKHFKPESEAPQELAPRAYALPGDELATEDTGAYVGIAEGRGLLLGPRARVKVLDAEGAGAAAFALVAGAVLVVGNDAAGAGLAVALPEATAGAGARVRATGGRVLVGPQGPGPGPGTASLPEAAPATPQRIVPLAGKAEIFTAAGNAEVKPGEMALVAAGAKPETGLAVEVARVVEGAPWIKVVDDLVARGAGEVEAAKPAPIDWFVDTHVGVLGRSLPVRIPSLAANAEAFVEHGLRAALGPHFRDWLLLYSALATVSRVLIAFIIASVIAVPLGIFMGAFTKAEAFFEPLRLTGLYVPLPALMFLIYVIFGATETAKVGFLTVAIFVVLLPQVVLAVHAVPQTFIDTARTLGATRPQIVRLVLVSVSKADIMQALRLSFGVGFTWIILAEALIATSGMGYVISYAQQGGRGYPKAFIYMVIASIVIIAITVNALWSRLERRLFPYRDSEH